MWKTLLLTENAQNDWFVTSRCLSETPCRRRASAASWLTPTWRCIRLAYPTPHYSSSMCCPPSTLWRAEVTTREVRGSSDVVLVYLLRGRMFQVNVGPPLKPKCRELAFCLKFASDWVWCIDLPHIQIITTSNQMRYFDEIFVFYFKSKSPRCMNNVWAPLKLTPENYREAWKLLFVIIIYILYSDGNIVEYYSSCTWATWSWLKITEPWGHFTLT